MEEAETDALFEAPLHPYTFGLLAASPRIANNGHGPGLGHELGRGRLAEIPGTVPALIALPPGCRFAPRCPLASERCRHETPPLVEHRLQHHAACWHAGEMEITPHD